MRRWIASVALLMVSFVEGQSQTPALSWDFGGGKPFTDRIDGRVIKVDSNKCAVGLVAQNGETFLKGPEEKCLLSINALDDSFQSEFTIDFVFRGNQFYYTTYPKADLRIAFAYNYLMFVTASIRNGKEVSDEWVVKLDGKKVPSYLALANDQWHHFVFRASAGTGEKNIIIDGILYSDLIRKIPPGNPFLIGANDGFQYFSNLRSMSFYKAFLSDEAVALKADGVVNDVTDSDRKLTGQSRKILNRVETFKYQNDSKSFAPGFPNYSIDAIDQLRQFPLPRYAIQAKTLRNCSWMDISYLHRKYSGDQKLLPKPSPKDAVELMDELTRNWNFYLELPCLRSDSVSVNKVYKNGSSIESALIQFANQHPEIPTSTILYQGQLRPTHAGFDSPRPFILSQELPDRYYLRDDSGKPIIFQRRKWLSPAAPLDLSVWDGQTSGFYLRQLGRYLNNPIRYIGENGEVYGHKRPAQLFNQDPEVRRLIDQLKLNNDDFNGWFQYRLDSAYRASIVTSSASTGALFCFYEVSAVKNDYWPAYRQRLNTNSNFNGEPRSTPSFYPVSPSNWQSSRGPWNGYGVIAAGRALELGYGVQKFAPFVSAGWSDEQDNIRPAQWLALLKSMVMLGADFFNVGYFNVTDANGKWQNGWGPNDPRGYIYQAAMPAYAQAIASHVSDFFEKGELLPGDFGKDPIRQFRFRGKKETELILVRKLGDRYLIYGSLQPLSNNKGEVADSSLTSISLEGKKVQFLIRPQGSMYILTMANQPVLLPLDSWHERNHPSYWSKSIHIEAELMDKGDAPIRTTGNDGLNFTKYTTFVDARPGIKLHYNLPARRPGNYKVVIQAKADGNSVITGTIAGKSFSSHVTSKNFASYTLGTVELRGQSSAFEYQDNLVLSVSQHITAIDSIELVPE